MVVAGRCIGSGRLQRLTDDTAQGRLDEPVVSQFFVAHGR
jgi:hypothetical protein